MNPEGTFCFRKFAANVYKSATLLQTHFSWIVDSGATDHMCSNKSLFLSLTKLSNPQSIGLPDGHDTSVSFIGSVKLHDSIVLEGALYVPAFQ